MNYELITYCSEDTTRNYFFGIIDLITIVTFLATVLFFMFDKYFDRKSRIEEYLNRLISLKFELSKNLNVISGLIKIEEGTMKLGDKLIYFRYDVLVTESLITSGEILNSDILRNLDAILGREKQINLLLDGILNMGEMSHVQTSDIGSLFKRRIISSSNKVLEMVSDLDNYYPKVISEISKYINEQKEKKFLDIIKYNLDIKDKEIKDDFWGKELYFFELI